jgi:dTDP-glucose 4,6-dehydratase
LIPSTISRLFLGEDAILYGDGKNVRDWIHVDDHVSGIWSAIEKGSLGSTYLFGSRDEVENITIVKEILRILELPERKIKFVTDRKGHDLRYSIDPTETENELGWKPSRRGLLVELPELVEWYLQDNRRKTMDKNSAQQWKI